MYSPIDQGQEPMNKLEELLIGFVSHCSIKPVYKKVGIVQDQQVRKKRS